MTAKVPLGHQGLDPLDLISALGFQFIWCQYSDIAWIANSLRSPGIAQDVDLP